MLASYLILQSTKFQYIKEKLYALKSNNHKSLASCKPYQLTCLYICHPLLKLQNGCRLQMLAYFCSKTSVAIAMFTKPGCSKIMFLYLQRTCLRVWQTCSSQKYISQTCYLLIPLKAQSWKVAVNSVQIHGILTNLSNSITAKCGDYSCMHRHPTRVDEIVATFGLFVQAQCIEGGCHAQDIIHRKGTLKRQYKNWLLFRFNHWIKYLSDKN